MYQKIGSWDWNFNVVGQPRNFLSEVGSFLDEKSGVDHQTRSTIWLGEKNWQGDKN
jgi:hypothetical protein